jgi:ABC-2 type transport system permease protein
MSDKTSMKGTITVFKKEFRGYLHSPVAYVMTFVFLIICGYFFQASMNRLNRYSAQYPMMVQRAVQYKNMGARMPAPPNLDNVVVKGGVFGVMSFLLIFIIPILTMRIYSEEYRGGTIELLWTSPISAGAVLAGKFLAALLLFTCMMTLTLVFIAIAGMYAGAGSGPDIGLVAANMIGVLLMGATFISIGIFASALTENQIVAAVISFSVLLFFLVIGAGAGQVGNYAAAEFLRYLSITGHMDAFQRGVLSGRDALYYISLTGFMLFLTNRVIESRRWRA